MASFLGRVMSASAAAVQAFRESYLSADTLQPFEFSHYPARQLRYAVYWSLYENSAYRNIVHSWATKLKSDLGLYKYIRNIYNPSFRLGSFYQTYLMGGALDPDAGDGTNP